MNALSRRLGNWTQTDDRALARLVEYLRATEELVLLLNVKEGAKARLVCFADADFAGERHSRRSTSGWIIGLMYEDESFVALHWSCATQKVVVLSTAEAELRALTDATRSVLGSQGLVQRLMGLVQRLMDCAGDERCHPLVYCDAQAALDAVQNGYSAKMRYGKTLQVNPVSYTHLRAHET